MRAQRSLHWLFGVIGVLLVFMIGFYVGTLDAHEQDIVITSQCTGISVSESFSANFESVDGQVIRDERQQSKNYSTRCMCFASDAAHQNIWVDTIEIAGENEDDVRNECLGNCQALCEDILADFSFAE